MNEELDMNACEECGRDGDLHDGTLFWSESTGRLLCRGCRSAAPIRPSNAQIDAEFQRRQEYRQFKDLKR